MKKLLLLLAVLIMSLSVNAQDYPKDLKIVKSGGFKVASVYDLKTKSYIKCSDYAEMCGIDSLKKVFKISLQRGEYKQSRYDWILETDCVKFTENKLEVSEENSDETKIYNFSISKTGVIWQNIYDTDLNKEQIKAYFGSQTFMELKKETESSMTFSINKLSLNTTKFFSRGLTPFFLLEPMSSIIMVQWKDNRYRITLSNVIFTSTTDWSLGGVSTNSNTQSTLDEYAYNYRRGKFKSMFVNTNANIANTIFFDLFDIKKIETTTSDDW